MTKTLLGKPVAGKSIARKSVAGKSVAAAAWLLTVALLAPLALAPLALAEGVPNPGAIQGESTRTLQRLEQQHQPPAPPGPPVTGPEQAAPTGPAATGPRFLLRSVELPESAFLPREELEATAARWVGREVSFADLQEMVAAINGLYRQRGIVTASAVLPPQNIEGGRVRVALVEGRLGKVAVAGNSYTAEGYVLRRLGLEQQAVVDTARLREDIVYFNRTNDTQLRAALEPGEGFGQTDVQVAVLEPRRTNLSLFYDNQGVNSVGEHELGLYLRRLSNLLPGDMFSGYVTGAPESGSVNGNAYYSLPLDRFGDKLSLSYARNDIKVVNGPFAALDITGNFQLGAVALSHPFLATESWLVLGTLSGSLSESESFVSGVKISSNTVAKGTAGASLTHSGARHTLTLTQGVSLAHADDNVLDSRGDFVIANGTLSGVVALWAGLSVTANVGWQYTAEENLPPDQLFQVGGPVTVRGYQVDVLSGDSGYCVQTELHHPVPPVAGLDAFVFFDRGEVFATFPSHREINGAGLGFLWSWRSRVTAEFALGFPLDEVVPNQDDYRLYGRLTWHVL